MNIQDLMNRGGFVDSAPVHKEIKWLDKDGFSAWEDEPWKPIIVYAQHKQMINVVSPSFKATDFRLMFKNPDSY